MRRLEYPEYTLALGRELRERALSLGVAGDAETADKLSGSRISSMLLLTRTKAS
jgi:hypothetical protein